MTPNTLGERLQHLGSSGPLSRLGSRRARGLAIAVGILLVVALSVPLGLMVLNQGGNAPASGSADYSATGDSPGADVGAPIAPGADGYDSSGQAESDAGAKSPNPGVAKGRQGAASDTPVIGPKVARSAWLGVKVGDLVSSSAKARLAATAAGGTVVSENVVTSSDPHGWSGGGYPGGYPGKYPEGVEDRSGIAPVPPVGVDEARLVLSVPTAKLDPLLTDLSTLGTVSYRSSQSQDLTGTYVDTRARIQPAKDGIARIRALLLKATSLDQIISLEAEISRRQADLDSLEQQLAHVERVTSMSDVTLALWTDATQRTEPQGSDNQFVANLRDAWNALLTSLTVILTGLAVLLPWLLIAAVVTWLVLRSRRRRGGAAPSTAD